MDFFYIQARFGVFRVFSGGTFRPSAGFITPSAAYGLLLNIAGIEMRKDDGKSPMTLIKNGLPEIQLALGAASFPNRHVVFQQLHNYPVGASGKERAAETKENKYNIAPVKRDILSDIRAYIAVDGNDDISARVKEGLAGKIPRAYGLPFLGDNNFLIDRFEPVGTPEAAYWFQVVDEESEAVIREHATRMTVSIDRADLSRSRSRLFSPTDQKTQTPPHDAWVEVGYA